MKCQLIQQFNLVFNDTRDRKSATTSAWYILKWKENLLADLDQGHNFGYQKKKKKSRFVKATFFFLKLVA